MRALVAWVRSMLSRAPRPGEVDRELAFHVDELTRVHIGRGLPPAEARRQALVDFGGREQACQAVRDVHVSRLLERLHSGSQAAFRFMRRSPAFSATVVVTLALSIGANAAVFSAVDAVLLRPLAFPHADRLLSLRQVNFKSKSPQMLVAPQRLEDWNRLNTTFTAITGWYTQSATDASGAVPVRIKEAFVAPRFLAVWGIAPLLGRDFNSAEHHFGGPNAVLISYAFWQQHFHGDPRTLGEKLGSGRTRATIVGVLPQRFRFPEVDVDVFYPDAPDAPYAQDRDSTWFTTVGRLRPGVPLAAARADLAHVQQQLGRAFPKTDAGLTVELTPLKQVVLQRAGSSLWLLYGAVSLLLLIACVNIATLLLARTAERQHEIAIRYALGASRTAIILQLLSEVFALALAGALLGLILAAFAVRLFHLFDRTLPRVDEITLSWSVVTYTLLCGVSVTMGCGFIPALRGTRRDIAVAMAQGSPRQVSSRVPLQWALVGAQVALSVALLVGAGLLLRSLANVGAVQPGFRADHVLTFHLTGSYAETVDYGRLTNRINRDLDTVRALPEVQTAATAAVLPGAGGSYPVALRTPDGPVDPTHRLEADERFVSAGYFSTLRIPVLQGRTCRAESPGAGALFPQKPTLLVNRSFARAYMSGSAVLGYHLREAAAATQAAAGEIVGIVGDAREESLTTAPQPTVYWCISAPDPDPVFLVRVSGSPLAFVQTVRAAMRRVEPGRSVYQAATLADVLADQSADARLRTALLTLFALTATALVSIGLWGTTAYLGRVRTPEMGLRLALGAVPAQIVRIFLRQSLRAGLLGCAVGLALGAALTPLLGSMLYRTSTLDPLTYVAVAAFVVLVAAAASLVPSVRAARVEPATVLRGE